MTLTGNNPTLNVVNITADEWGGVGVTRNLSAAAGSTVLVNIAGSLQNLSGGTMSLAGGLDRTHALLDFYQTTQFTSSSLEFQGSVLAPWPTPR